jgi:hypothetical protein
MYLKQNQPLRQPHVAGILIDVGSGAWSPELQLSRHVLATWEKEGREAAADLIIRIMGDQAGLFDREKLRQLLVKSNLVHATTRFAEHGKVIQQETEQ